MSEMPICLARRCVGFDQQPFFCLQFLQRSAAAQIE
jgi:hypothetical protein